MLLNVDLTPAAASQLDTLIGIESSMRGVHVLCQSYSEGTYHVLGVFAEGYIKTLSSNRDWSVTTAKSIGRNSTPQAPLARENFRSSQAVNS